MLTFTKKPTTELLNINSNKPRKKEKQPSHLLTPKFIKIFWWCWQGKLRQNKSDFYFYLDDSTT